MARKVKVKENNCSNCADLLSCPEILTYTCKNYARAEPGKVKEPEKPAISKRNKDMIALIEQGKGIKEIATELNLDSETVKKELEYLTTIGMVKAAQ